MPSDPMRLSVRLLALMLCAALAVLPGLAAAQSAVNKVPNYAAWEELARQAERMLEEPVAPTQDLEDMRGLLADWRSRFLDAQNVNQERIQTVRNQLATLGPAGESAGDTGGDSGGSSASGGDAGGGSSGAVPDLPGLDTGGAGAEDVPGLDERRKELQAQLDNLLAPVQRAEAAYTRADGLISEIDTIVRERQAEALMTRGPMPVNPAHWPGTAAALMNMMSTLASETTNRWDLAVSRGLLDDRLPGVLLYLAIAAVLIWRGSRWVKDLVRYARRHTERGAGVWSFLISLGQILVPVIGLLLLAQALLQTGLVGPTGDALLRALPRWGVVVLGTVWLAGRLFPADDEPAVLNLAPEQRRQMRFGMGALAFAFVLQSAIGVLGGTTELSPEHRAVLHLPVMVLAGIFLFRIGQLLRRHVQNEEETETEFSFGRRLAGLLGRASQAVAVLGPLGAALGYLNAVDAVVYPFLLTCALLGLVLVLQRLVVDLYALVTNNRENPGDQLVPILLGFSLVVAAMPLVALIWGARVSDLTELWAQFREGFAIGDTRISPTDFITFAVVFGVGYMATRLLQGTLRSSVLPKTRIDPGGQNAIVAGLGYVGIVLAAVIAITTAGIDLSSLAIVAGALSVGIGFGLQNIVSNFVSGIILLIERPISEGDWIQVGDQMGYVRDISVRSTRIETFDRTDVIVPNADLVSGQVINWTRGNSIGRVIVPVGVAYGTDTKRVEKILLEIAKDHPMVVANPSPAVIFQGFGADSLDFEIRAILRDVNFVLAVKSDMNHAIAKRFTEEGIEIPFAQRDVWLRNPETLRGGSGASGGPGAPGQDEARDTAPKADIREHHDPAEDGPDGEQA